MTVPRREGDPEDADHTKERRPQPFRWEEMAPRWFLVLWIAALLILVGGLGRELYVSRENRLEALERNERNRQQVQIDDLREQQVILAGRVRELEKTFAVLTDMQDRVRDVQFQIRLLTKAERQGR